MRDRKETYMDLFHSSTGDGGKGIEREIVEIDDKVDAELGHAVLETPTNPYQRPRF